MKIMIFGYGSIGKRHTGLLREHFDHEVYLFRTKGKKQDVFPEVRTWKDVDAIAPDVAMICNPTNRHIETAIKCARRGMALFIEKPLDVSTKRLGELTRLITAKQLPSYMAYPFRFHPVIQSWRGKMVGKDRWAKIICYTDIDKWGKEYSKKVETGGGVVFELSHELDIAQFLFGPITDIHGVIEKEKDARSLPVSSWLTTTHEDGMRVRFQLTLNWEGKPLRRISFSSHLKKMEEEYQATDEMYLNQLRWFFDNLSFDMMNNVIEATPLFEKICGII